ncbi:hypothetical protein LPW11_08705 [Geomonas sp. RF6]|uniref:FlgO family outer membrane protein n=1 Tax=Geomonas sp. RF6 TaxID=2897342 RepID=UPI001E59ABBE|nr:FlgO family outer membrane protein [Geomonas sp. RF6]UFS72258.1 hypothetical protein LPW11_08705 [Geomonas sp. RF6]
MKVAAILLLLLTISGCVYDNGFHDSYPAVAYQTLDARLERVALKTMFDQIAGELCTQTCATCEGEKVVVTDFVDLRSFTPGQPGLTMAELMRGSLSKVCGSRIIQGEFSKYFKLSGEGFVALTRSAAEVNKDSYTERHVIVGTYEYNRSKLLIFVKKIDAQTNQVNKMVTKEVDFSSTLPQGYVIR